MLQRFSAKRQFWIDQSNSKSDAGFNGTAGEPPAIVVNTPQFSLPGASAVYSYGVSVAAISAAAPYQVTTRASANVRAASPSWISQIQTASIAADMSAAIVNGQVTYSGLLATLLDDFDSQVTATDTSGLSASETLSASIAATASHAIARSTSALPPALANFIRPVQGVEPHHLFSPKALAA